MNVAGATAGIAVDRGRPSVIQRVMPSVEHGNGIVPVCAQRPPHACGDRHVMVVVGHDERVVTDACRAHRCCEALGRGEHARRPIRVRELCVPSQVHGTGDVPRSVLVVTAPLVERSQVPAAVDDPHAVVVEVIGEPRGGDEGTPTQSFGGGHRATC